METPPYQPVQFLGSTTPVVEYVLGLGRQLSLPKVVEAADAQYRTLHGAPAKLTLCSGDVEVQAERSAEEAPFDAWTIRFVADGELVEAVRRLQSEWNDTCTLREVEGRQEFHLRCPPDADRSSALQPLGSLSDLLSLGEVWRIRGEDFPRGPLSPEALFRAMRDLNASDVHLYPGSAPVFRIDDATRHSEEFAVVTQRQIEELIRNIAPAAAWGAFEADKQCSFNYRQVGLAYSRVSAFIKAGVPHCTIRYLPEALPTFEDLHIPRGIMERLANLHEGLVLITGMTGSGKSTTVASLVDWINENKSLHILTIESPVEFVHVNKRSIVSQRNVGTDTQTAVEAVRGAVRHDPDVIFIGEMRDSDTIRAAIDAAGTGHLVVSTFHSNTAAEVPNRIVSFFDPVERDLVRLQLRDCIRCVMCQRLVPRLGGGRLPALEFLFNDTVHVGEGILSGDTAALRVAMQQSTSASTIFEQSLLGLVRQKLIEEEVAATYASNAAVLEQMRLGTYSTPGLETMFPRRE